LRRFKVKNAPERFGWIEFTRAMKDTTARVRLRLDRCIAELRENGHEGRLHLLSVVGGESDVSAAWAAVHQNQIFKVEGRNFAALDLSLGEKAECYRGGFSLSGRRHPVRHLVAVSAELTATRLGAATESSRTILSDNDPVFVLYRLSERFGLPVVPEWADLFMSEMKRRRAIRLLVGLGCSPVLITGTKARFLRWISHGLRRREINFPVVNASIRWPEMQMFLDRKPIADSRISEPC
jgi:hypothetical protein